MATGVIVVLWLGILPRIASNPGVDSRIRFLRQHKIDPSAMFYTEVEAMGGVQERMAAIQRQHGSRFWQPKIAESPPVAADPNVLPPPAASAAGR